MGQLARIGVLGMGGWFVWLLARLGAVVAFVGLVFGARRPAYWPICVVSPLAFGSLFFVAEAVGLCSPLARRGQSSPRSLAVLSRALTLDRLFVSSSVRPLQVSLFPAGPARSRFPALFRLARVARSPSRGLSSSSGLSLCRPSVCVRGGLGSPPPSPRALAAV